MSITKPSMAANSMAKLKSCLQSPQTSYVFEDILAQEFPTIDTGLPSARDVVRYLKLLKCFQVLKRTIECRTNSWKGFVTVAVRRFCMFMNVIKQLEQECMCQSEFNSRLSAVFPPLDIILVWHGFILNTKSFMGHVRRNNLVKFYNYGFPLKRVAECVSNTTYLYTPSNNYFEVLMSKYGLQESFQLDIYPEFYPEQESFPLYCSVCSTQLAIIPLKGRNAFDNFEVFSSENCGCGFSPLLNKDEVCKRKFWRDIMEFWFDRKTGNENNGDNGDVCGLNTLTHSFNALVSKTFSQFAADLKSAISFKSYIHLKVFLTTNPIEATVQNNQFKIHDDLADFVIGHESFETKIEQSEWLYSDFLQDNLEESIERYENFLDLFDGAEFPIIPTLDIDLVWHTHQLSQHRYQSYTKQKCGFAVSHNVDYQQDSMAHGFEMTSHRYKQRYKKNYSACFCGYCSYQRFKSRGLFSFKPRLGSNAIKNAMLHSDLIGCTQSSNSSISHTKNYQTKYNNDTPWYHKGESMVVSLSPILEDGQSISSGSISSGINTPFSDVQSSWSSESSITPTTSLFEKSF